MTRLKHGFLFVSCLIIYYTAAGQEVPDSGSVYEQRMETVTEANADSETEDDSYLQQLQSFKKSPVNLNYADESELNQLMILSPVQIQNLISYRNVLGNFISLYELQAIPGWDVRTVENLRPFVTVATRVSMVNSLRDRLKGGEHFFLFRGTQVLEKSKGYKSDSSAAVNLYQGSPQKIFMRYKYQYKNLLQYGIVGEKDAGEQFFKGGQRQGFDFYSAHFFVRNIGIIKAMALGDFTVNMGQGLVQWQSLAFKKSSDVINIKHQLSILRPYNSAGEINFHRGAGITFCKKNLEASFFGSCRKLDANFAADTLNNEDFITSFQTSGYHRTSNEIADKGVQRQITYGGNISFSKKALHLGLNAIQYKFRFPVNKSADPYNLFAISGSRLGNYSMDYSYTFKNLHLFGEVAVSNTFNKAFINGIMLSAAANVDLSLLYRNISKGYQSLYTNAFTESTFPTNEKGFYAGICVRPNYFWRIDAYADFYQFPWLKYNIDAPSVGADYLIQTTYQPNKQLCIYMKYRSESKSANFKIENSVMLPVIAKSRQNFRSQLNYKLSRSVTVRERAELIWFDKRGNEPATGFLLFSDLLYKPMMKKYSGNLRFQYFETDNYNSRMYAYENDVLYSYSIPVFYDKGIKYYLNLNYDVNKKLSFWFRWAQTIYKDKKFSGSGLDEISGRKKSEFKLQLQYMF